MFVLMYSATLNLSSIVVDAGERSNISINYLEERYIIDVLGFNIKVKVKVLYLPECRYTEYDLKYKMAHLHSTITYGMQIFVIVDKHKLYYFNVNYFKTLSKTAS